jgi:hypothetical protein
MPKLTFVGPSLLLNGPLTLKNNTHIGIMSKPHVEHDTCNISHISELGKHIGVEILHNWLIQQ